MPLKNKTLAISSKISKGDHQGMSPIPLQVLLIILTWGSTIIFCVRLQARDNFLKCSAHVWSALNNVLQSRSRGNSTSSQVTVTVQTCLAELGAEERDKQIRKFNEVSIERYLRWQEACCFGFCVDSIGLSFLMGVEKRQKNGQGRTLNFNVMIWAIFDPLIP